MSEAAAKPVVRSDIVFAEKDKALRDDVQDFFPKPVKIKELKASIKRALEKKTD